VISAFFLVLTAALCAGIGAVAYVFVKGRSLPDHPGAIPFLSLCPGCGHRGCTLRFIEPPAIEVDPVRGIVNRKVEDAKIERTCTHCGAKCYQAPVMPPKEWIG
jgi:hypothetical protein